MVSWKTRLIIPLVSLFIILLLHVSTVKAWTQEDYEIFDLVDELENAEGKSVNFYSWLGVDPSATDKEINRAYRKMSLALHPDKNPDKSTQEKFARLGSITAILRSPKSRERYNFFLKNGVPRWRIDGYFYKRHRPGVGSVLFFLLIMGLILQYLIMWINFYQERKRVRYYIQEAREVAWGKRMKKQMTRKRVNVNDLQFVVEGDYIALLTEEGEEFPLDEDEIVVPRVQDSLMFVLPVWAYKTIKERLLKFAAGKKSAPEEGSADDKSSFSSDDDQSAQSEVDAKTRHRRRKNVGKRSNRK